MPASPARPRLLRPAMCLACALLLPAAGHGQTPADLPGSEGPVAIPFEMPFDGQASIVLYRQNGHVLRPLAQLLALKKGRWQARWDGLDLWGHLLPAGTKAVAKVIISPGLKATYEFSAAAPNRIPWLSRTFGQGEARRTGGWLGDHSPPWCIVGLWHRIFIGCPLAEHGHNIIYTNLDGEKMWGGKLKGWSGPEYLTTDGRHVYCIGRHRTSVSRTDLGAERAELLADTKGRRIEAMAVREGRIYLTLPPKARPKPDDADAIADLILEVRDAETGTLLDEIDHPGARSMTRMVFDADGRCYSLVGTKLCRTVIGATSVEHAVLNDKELRRPISLAVDPTMGDRVAAGDEQRDAVFVFDTGGKLLLTIGGVGPRKRGPWNPNTVDRPMGVTFDYRGRIWIAENYFTPKRVSRFAADGTFEKVFYGPPQYGGGGFLDPTSRASTTGPASTPSTGRRARAAWPTSTTSSTTPIPRTSSPTPTSTPRSGAPSTAGRAATSSATSATSTTPASSSACWTGPSGGPARSWPGPSRTSSCSARRAGGSTGRSRPWPASRSSGATGTTTGSTRRRRSSCSTRPRTGARARSPARTGATAAART